MDICKRMFDIMAEKNIKMIELARHLGVNKTVISAWKNRGTNPPIEYAVQICELLEISLEKLITGTDGKSLTYEEQSILDAYRTAGTDMKRAARKLLDIPEQEREKAERLSDSRTG